MSRQYTTVEGLTEIIRERKAAGKTNREIGERYGLSKRQAEQLINRQNRKEWLLAVGYIPRPKGRPRLATDTIRETLRQEKVTDGLALHSDQGSQYTSQAYFDLTQEYHVSPSISSPSCPYDNAAMENFSAP